MFKDQNPTNGSRIIERPSADFNFSFSLRFAAFEDGKRWITPECSTPRVGTRRVADFYPQKLFSRDSNEISQLTAVPIDINGVW